MALSNGWALIKFADGHSPPVDVMKRWIAESHELAAGGGAPAKKPAKKSDKTKNSTK